MATIIFNGEGFTVTAEFNSYLWDIPINEVWEKPIEDLVTFTDFTIYADEGHLIERAYASYSAWGEDIEDEFIINEGGKVATRRINLNSDYEYVVTVETIGSGGSDYEGGFNNLYLTDYKTLNSIAMEDLIRSWGQNNSIRIDLRDYIINVLEIPFNIPDDLIGDNENIQLGNWQLNTHAPSIKNNLFVLEMGSIEIPSKYGNSYDYMNTDIKLFLPYIKEIDLEVEYVIGYTISIQYLIDLYSGVATVNVYSSKTNKIIYSENRKLGRNIPFVSRGHNVVNSLSDENGINNGVSNAYIEVIRNVPSNLNKFSNRVTIENVLLHETGFISVNEIELKTSATLQEKNTINQLLRNGVVIK